MKTGWLLLWTSFVLACPVRAAQGPVVFRAADDAVEIDWNRSVNTGETAILENIMVGLVQHDEKLQPRPALAERWDISADQKTYTFHLRRDVKWSDGQPLRAQQFRDSWLRTLEPSTRAPYASFLFHIEGAEDFHRGKIKDARKVGVLAVDDSTLRVKLRVSTPFFLHMSAFWAMYPVRVDLIKKHGGRWTDPKNLVTLGPYRLTEWKKGSFLKMERNPMYFDGAPTVESVRVIIEPQVSRARELFLRGELDFLFPVTTETLTVLQQRKLPAVRLESFPYLVTHYLALNPSHPALRKKEVRSAIAMLIDKQALANRLQGGFLAAPSIVPPGLPGYSTEELQKRSPAEALRQLGLAGYIAGNGLPEIPLALSKSDEAEVIAQTLTSSLREAGIKVQTRILSSAEFERSSKGAAAALFFDYWAADYPDPATFFDAFSSKSGIGLPGWSNSTYNQLVDSARADIDPSHRLQAYREAEKILRLEDVVLVPVLHKKNFVAVGARIKNLDISPLNYLHFDRIRLKN